MYDYNQSTSYNVLERFWLPKIMLERLRILLLFFTELKVSSKSIIWSRFQ